MFAALVHVVLLVVGAFWIFQVIREPEKKVDFMPPGGGGGERGAEHQVQQKKRAQITPTANVKRVFAEGATASYAIPEQGDNFGEMSPLSAPGGGMAGGLGGAGSGQGFGKGMGEGGGLGKGGGVGKLFGMIPETMRKRCSKEDRLARLAENGGVPACEEAVIKALRWMKSQQKPDGSWEGASGGAQRRGRAASQQKADGSGEGAAWATGLALLAYMGHCETPVSDEFGESATKGIVYLVNLGMKNNGRMASNFTDYHWIYEHAISTYALGEAATFCKELKVEIPGLMEVTEKAGQLIIDNQHETGGWAYGFATKGGDPDTSIAGWQIQALKACSHTSIKYKGMSSCISKALAFINKNQNSNGGYGYSSSKIEKKYTFLEEYFTTTGIGMLCNQMWGKGESADVAKASKYILSNTRFDYNTQYCDLYGHYYESQAMIRRGGEEWKQYNKIFRDQLLNNQNANGSWNMPGGGKRPRAVAPEFVKNEFYRTALCTLMLEVYYRFLSSDGGGHRSIPGI
ncbi:MAG: prenyltransferase/squalene oxidase repeat-containing protein [Verrucomicrobiota bacterium]